jgi:hypothetical protein
VLRGSAMPRPEHNMETSFYYWKKRLIVETMGSCLR